MATGPVLFVTLFALSSLLCTTLLSADPSPHSFTLSLVHRDALNPVSTSSYLDNNSKFTQIQSAIARSIARANHISTFRYQLNSAVSYPKTNIIAASGEYIMNISIGTPPFPILAIADTGSDLTWTQCKPCTQCYTQNAPIFDTTNSSTYKPVSCSAPQCTSDHIGFNSFCDDSMKCHYSIIYGDQSTTSGTLALETFTLGSYNFSNHLFGCGFDNEGTFNSVGSGIIGLGNGPNSLIGQINQTIGGKFSYCLVPLTNQNITSSSINFGQNAVVSGDNVVSTPIVTKPPATYYHLTLEAITINGTRLPYIVHDDFNDNAEQKGNIVIDSGTTLLILPEDIHTRVETELRKHMKGKEVSGVKGLTLCYDSTTFKAPEEFVMNFEGADVKLSDINLFVVVEEGVACFASVPGSMAIYGSLAQMNFLVGYDKVGGKVSFKPADCASSG